MIIERREGYTFRWAQGKKFIAVWRSEWENATIPEDMIPMPTPNTRTVDDMLELVREYCLSKNPFVSAMIEASDVPNEVFVNGYTHVYREALQKWERITCVTVRMRVDDPPLMVIRTVGESSEIHLKIGAFVKLGIRREA